MFAEFIPTYNSVTISLLLVKRATDINFGKIKYTNLLKAPWQFKEIFLPKLTKIENTLEISIKLTLVWFYNNWNLY